MALLENRIEVDLGEGTIFELSEEAEKALGPPEAIAAQLDARPGERGVPEPLPTAAGEPAEVVTTNSEAFTEVGLVLEAAKVMAKPPSDETLKRVRELVAKRTPPHAKEE